MAKVFIDGSAGTTGLEISERLSCREDIELLLIPEEERKDPLARSARMAEADVVFLCLPDAAAVEAANLPGAAQTCLIDTSTAHRVSEGWVYGFPEIGEPDAIAASKRIANPGCHATGFLSIAAPLVKAGILPSDAVLSCFSLTGYSGGGKSMIASYSEDPMPEELKSPGIYGLTQAHKHLPEMQRYAGLQAPPVFLPVVDRYYRGMAVTVPFSANMLCGGRTMRDAEDALSAFYAASPLIRVIPSASWDPSRKIHANGKAGLDSLDLIICGNNERFTVTALFDNLGKGASGAAIENMNLVLGLPAAYGLRL